MITFPLDNHEWPSYPVMPLRSRIQITDAQMHVSCKGTRISSYMASCVFVRTCWMCALSKNGRRRPWRPHSILTALFLLESSSSSPPLFKPPVCPFTESCLSPVGATIHHRWNDQREGKKLHEEVRAKLLGRKQGGHLYMLKENPMICQLQWRNFKSFLS